MTENQISLSDDGMELSINSPSGQRATLRSARPGGFTSTDLENARTFQLNSKMVPGQVNQARRFRLGRKAFYVHVNTGPPTWWLPRGEVTRSKLMFGWLRVLVAVSWAST
jgi:hypothetical protein